VPSWDLATGRIPLVKYGAGGSSPRLDSIIDGSHDGEIRALAAGSRSMRKPFFFAPFWEMNGSWEPWNGVHTSDPGTHNGPMKYIRAWRRMHDIFVRQGVRNAVWVWSPDRGDVPREPWNHWWRYYPGDAYVDWVGMDGYNWGTAADWSSWRSWEDVFRPLYLDFASRKPVMVAETASAERGGHKARWIRNARAAIKARFPQLGAVVWFHDDKETDWRVNSSRRSLAAYRAWVHDPYFNVGAEPASITFRAAYRLGRALRRGVAASVGSMRSFRVVLRARLRRRTARRFGLSAASTVVARGRAAVTIPGTRRVRLRFSRPAQRRLREARRVSVHVSARVFERGGSTKTRQAFALVR
jgi:endoglucanase